VTGSAASRQCKPSTVVGKTLELISAFLTTSDDLLVGINTAYAEQGRSKREIDALRKWKTELTQRRDAADYAWRREEKLLGYSLAGLFREHPSVAQTWQRIGESVMAFEGVPTSSTALMRSRGQSSELRRSVRRNGRPATRR
jgi:hypothetical protein